MKIMITGGCGHIGSNLFRQLPEHDITIVDNLRTQRYTSLFRVPRRVKFIQKDINKLAFRDFNDIDVVIHLAAVVDAAGAEPEAIEEINVSQTKEFIEQCLSANIPKFIFPSSTSVYGMNAEKVWEDDMFVNPQSAYAESKITIEQFLKESGLEYLILRFGTIFGTSPGMRFHTAINKFCWQASVDEPLTIWKESFHLLRPYLGLGDAIRAIRHFLHNPKYVNDTFNIITRNYKASDIVSMIERQNGKVKLNMVDTPLLNQYSYEVSGEKASAVGFHPTDNLQDAIGKTIQLLKGLK
jgi:nucleoside-diphosphate-sugar epimerase